MSEKTENNDFVLCPACQNPMISGVACSKCEPSNEQKLRLALGVLIDFADMLIAKNLLTIVYLKPSVRILVRDHIKRATEVYDATKPDKLAT